MEAVTQSRQEAPSDGGAGKGYHWFILHLAIVFLIIISSYYFFFEGFILFIVERDGKEGMGERGEDMQQRTTDRNRTWVAAVRTGT